MLPEIKKANQDPGFFSKKMCFFYSKKCDVSKKVLYQSKKSEPQITANAFIF